MYEKEYVEQVLLDPYHDQEATTSLNTREYQQHYLLAWEPDFRLNTGGNTSCSVL